MKIISFVFVFLLSSLDGYGAIVLSSLSTEWVAISSGGAGNYDYFDDQQTGQPQDDIVGDSNHPGFFARFDDAGTASKTDGMLAFRVRLNSQDGKKSNYTGYLWVGIDADLNGSIDVFLRYTGAKSGSVGIHAPGTDFNTSPSTTSIVSRAYVSYDLASNPSYYDYRPVFDSNTLPDDGGTSVNIDPKNKNVDYYVSFQLPFSDIHNFLRLTNNHATGSPILIDEDTTLRYIVATSTQGNSLNQDLGAIAKGFMNSKKSWADLGGFSENMTVSTNPIPTNAVPEPMSWMTAMVACMMGLLVRRR